MCLCSPSLQLITAETKWRTLRKRPMPLQQQQHQQQQQQQHQQQHHQRQRQHQQQRQQQHQQQHQPPLPPLRLSRQPPPSP